jgi:hypothetical protein
MRAIYDVFVSYPSADREPVQQLAQALRNHGLEVFVDNPEIDDFSRITTAITEGLARSKVLLAYYSAAYSRRRACQWELTAAYLAASRQGDPSRRILVVNPEPTSDHLYPGELRDALYHRAPAPGAQAALAELAWAVAEHVRGLPGPLGAVAPLVPPRWLPTQGLGSTRFVGRLPEMWRLHSALHPDTTRLTAGRSGPGVAQVRGLGGIGKSLLAEEYALRFGAAYPGGVFWLRAYGSHEQTDLPPEELDARRHDELRRLALGLGLSVKDRDPEELPGLLANAVEERGQACLWVVDDLPKGLDAHQIRAWLAPHPLAHTLVTTRSQAYGTLAAAVDLDVLNAQDAYQLLTSRRPPRDDDEAQAARAIVAALGSHALAVDVAGAALAGQQGLVSYTEFLTGLAAPDEDELELVTDLADALPNGHEASITRTLLRSTRQLGAEGQDFLRLAAVLAPAPIPAELVRAVFTQADRLAKQPATRRATRAVHQAATLSLASTTAAHEQAGMWLVHALVARATRYRDPDLARRAALREAAIAALTDQLAAIVDARAHVRLQAVVPHARELARNPETVAEANLLGWVARYDYQRGDFRPAEQGWRQQWDTYQRLVGDDHPATLNSINNLAETLRAAGDLHAARDLHQQTLDTRRRLLGPDHPDTLISMSNLATMLYADGDLAGARQLQQRVLDAYQRLLGPDHPDTLISINNLAETLRAADDLAGARQLQQQALDGRRRLLGPDHPSTLQSINNLAVTLHALRDLAGARQLQQQALDGRRRLLGPDHPDTLDSINNLAETLRDLGDLHAARDLHQQTFDARRRLLGDDHPNTLTSMDNLALTLYALGELQGARELLQQVRDAYRRLLGDDHPTTRAVEQNLAAIVRAQRQAGGRSARAGREA